MGYALSWAAVASGAPEAVQAALGLRCTGEQEDVAESDIVGAKLPNGRYVVVANHDCIRLTNDEVLSRLSKIGEVVMCFVEEHVMYSHAEFWSDGRCVWTVVHEAGQGIDHLEANGALPPPFGVIRDRLRSEQKDAGGTKADVDYIFDIPVELARSLAGYRHNEDTSELEEMLYDVLEEKVPYHTIPWWKRLFRPRPST